MDRLKGSELHHLKELRPGSGGRAEIRTIFAFDPTRSALLLLGGDRAGNLDRWYRDSIPRLNSPTATAPVTRRSEGWACPRRPRRTGDPGAGTALGRC
ncbi:type II toxin-antitoxin system RelE/ParE family toxin [Streptomyces coelicoflavus]|uniref:type II toxin-antitoxin system RelE/ParE family toxin n=1 Tax=Streptomyces coelicoflavus TaxID=285562 RepID=UPI003AF3305C